MALMKLSNRRPNGSESECDHRVEMREFPRLLTVQSSGDALIQPVVRLHVLLLWHVEVGIVVVGPHVSMLT